MRKGGENTMKTLEELYKEVQGNEELKKEFIAAFKEGRLEEFLKSQNSDAAPAKKRLYRKMTLQKLPEDALAVIHVMTAAVSIQLPIVRRPKGV